MIVTRFAPSPTGYLHLGHAYSALFAYRAAQESGGKFLLRIEDIDPARCKPQFTDDLMEDLHWLGLEWGKPVRRQSQHMDDYRAAMAKLQAMEVVYPCFCTRSEVAAEAVAAVHAPHTGPDGPIYSGTCRRLSASEREARLAEHTANWRLDVGKAVAVTGSLFWHDRADGKITAHPETFGDVVLARKDVPTSYHLSVTVDDHLQGVTLVTRGEDLFRATDIHRLLQALLNFETPEYHHHKMLTNASGQRLAKRDKAETLRALREAGKSSDDVRKMIGL